MEIFPKKGHSEIWSEKFFSYPQTQCKVSAHVVWYIVFVVVQFRHTSGHLLLSWGEQ